MNYLSIDDFSVILEDYSMTLKPSSEILWLLDISEDDLLEILWLLDISEDDLLEICLISMIKRRAFKNK